VQNQTIGEWKAVTTAKISEILEEECVQVIVNLHDACKFASNTVEAIWCRFWKEHDFYAKGLQWLKLWRMIIHRLKFKTCKLLEAYWIFVGFNTIFTGPVFLGHPVQAMKQDYNNGITELLSYRQKRKIMLYLVWKYQALRYSHALKSRFTTTLSQKKAKQKSINWWWVLLLLRSTNMPNFNSVGVSVILLLTINLLYCSLKSKIACNISDKENMMFGYRNPINTGMINRKTFYYSIFQSLWFLEKWLFQFSKACDLLKNDCFTNDAAVRTSWLDSSLT